MNKESPHSVPYLTHMLLEVKTLYIFGKRRKSMNFFFLFFFPERDLKKKRFLRSKNGQEANMTKRHGGYISEMRGTMCTPLVKKEHDTWIIHMNLFTFKGLCWNTMKRMIKYIDFHDLLWNRMRTWISPPREKKKNGKLTSHCALMHKKCKFNQIWNHTTHVIWKNFGW